VPRTPVRLSGSWRLDSGDSTVHRQINAGYVAALVRAQAQGRGGNLFRSPNPAEQRERCELCFQFFRGFLGINLAVDDGRVNRPRANDVCSDLAVLQLFGPRTGEGPSWRYTCFTPETPLATRRNR